MKRVLIVLSVLALLAACAAAPEPPASGSAGPSQPAPPVSASQPPPASSQGEPPSSSAPEAEPDKPSSVPEAEPDKPSSVPEEDPQPLPEAPSALSPEPTYEEMKDIDLLRSALRAYLVETLTEERYTNFHITEDQMGLGVSAPDIEAVKEAVDAYDGPKVKMEYREVPHSRARLDAAKEAYRRMEADLAEHIICNISWSGVWDGMIHITIHQMHPALQEFLDTSEYADCFAVEVTGADSPIVNPDT